jgi:hypothetical protein
VYSDTSTKRDAYHVVEYESVESEDVVSVVQLTGDTAPALLQFSCLGLGDSDGIVQRQLGPPEWTTPFEVQESRIHGVRWDYSDPFSIEIVNGRVFSLRVWRPHDMPAKRPAPAVYHVRRAATDDWPPGAA